MKTFYPGFAALSILLAGCSGGGSGDNAPVNQAPTISVIAQQSTTANTSSAPIAFTVTDEQPGTVSISVTSDRQQIVPDDGLAVAGSGTNRSVTATPVLDETGDAMVTIIATDTGGLSASSSFLLVVDPEQRSMQQFARETFADDADDDPELINAVDFVMDAEADDFSDLLEQ